MPQAAIKLGAADRVVPLSGMPQAILDAVVGKKAGVHKKHRAEER
jgi:chemotaxis response regulator CheB